METSLYNAVHQIFWYIEPFKHGSPVWQADGQNRDSMRQWKCIGKELHYILSALYHAQA